MRLFIAIRTDRKMNSALVDLMHKLKAAGVRGKYAPLQNLHVTLTFIGETDRQQEIKEILSSIPVPEIRIGTDKLEIWGDVLVLTLKGNQKLKAYVASLRKALDAAGIDYDHKIFSPHLTLVRKASGNIKGIAVPKAEMTGNHVSLLKSSLKDGKRIYTEI